MPRRHPNLEESAAERQLVLDFYTATGEFYPALVLEETVKKLLGLMPAGMKAATDGGFLVPAHAGQYKTKQYALIDVIKLMFNKRALMEIAHAGAEEIEAKNKRDKAARLKTAKPSAHQNSPAKS
jgi:hypothetical protein